MIASFDLDQYLNRIQYAGGRSVSLETLSALHACHPAAIPFENLDPLLGRPVRLDVDSLQRKLVADGRGGYCYEHNLLFAEALKALGFIVTGLAARVAWNVPEGARRPRSHMLLRVEINGVSHIADVGFGGLTLTAPLRLEAGVEQTTPHETFRLIREGREFVQEARVREAWTALYRFTEDEQDVSDYEVANWYTSTHPESIFRRALMAARATREARYALLDGRLTIHNRNGATEQRVLRNGSELKMTLMDIFGIRPPDSADLDTVLERLTREPAARQSVNP
ncbi:MAG TPA: arylamine N-acetyltransferase [Vicinamibacterales bacterium]|nr:arylamine N-acetyltransferase [Vicinamibacterales bacterium]